MAVVDNGLSSPASGQVLMVGDTATVNCSTNFVLNGSATVTCQNSDGVGTLSALPTCEGELPFAFFFKYVGI